MKHLIGAIEHLQLEWRIGSSRPAKSYSGFRFLLDGHPCMLWVEALDKGPALREGQRVEIAVSDGELIDRVGSNALFALRTLDDDAVFVCHGNMGLFRGNGRITSMSYARFKDAKTTLRTYMLLVVSVFFGLSLWQHGTADLPLVACFLAPLLVITEGWIDFYDYSWNSQRPTPTQQRTNELYALMGAGSPLHPAANVHAI
ncbi:hypothetical protein [Dyella telluris]|uniref:Uncharacterized protein n=1 Tax=Dyella telluris TaxID=2763498 RepID=A0A7G8Q867_9GAMM|nr:hypothetical protein [Dyella telluris]QNK02975.1 hypothetical protein H8F01_07655 [Dyella telluris]